VDRVSWTDSACPAFPSWRQSGVVQPGKDIPLSLHFESAAAHALTGVIAPPTIKHAQVQVARRRNLSGIVDRRYPQNPLALENKVNFAS
jgi:hypothetical protein